MNMINDIVLEAYAYGDIAEEGAQKESIKLVNSTKMKHAIKLMKDAQKALNKHDKATAIACAKESKKVTREIRKELTKIKGGIVSFALAETIFGTLYLTIGIMNLLRLNPGLFPNTVSQIIMEYVTFLNVCLDLGFDMGSFFLKIDLAAHFLWDLERLIVIKLNGPKKMENVFNRTRQVCIILCDDLVEANDKIIALANQWLD